MRDHAKLIDDLAMLAGGAVNLAAGAQRQIRDEIRSRVNELADHLDFVPREDFDRLESAFKASCERQSALEQRIADLERTYEKNR